MPSSSRAQTDTFNDGDDTLYPIWTHYDPFAGFGAPATFSFPGGNTYRIQAPTSPDPGTLGPARAASTVDTIYTDFYASVDLVDWDDTLDQAFGLLARLENIGLGTSTGYAFTYQELDHDISISRIVNEAASDLPGTSISLTLYRTNDYRLVFIGKGDHFEGRVYQLPNIDTPIAITRGTDSSYASGASGLVVFDNSSGGAATADATFDNVVFSGVQQVLCGDNPPIMVDNFNDQNDNGWTHYPTPQDLSQTWTFPTNPASGGNYAYRLTSVFGTTLAALGRVASIRDGDPDSSDFCITLDLIDWNNGASQNMGILARVQTNYQGTPIPHCYALVYANRFSSGSGGTDQLRIYELLPNPGNPLNAASIHLHNGKGELGQFNVVAGGDLAPVPSRDYRLVFKGVGNVLTGQIIDLSTGIPMTFNDGFGGLTNMLATLSATNLAKGKTGIITYQGSGTPGPGTQPDATFDNFQAHAAAPTAVISQTGSNVTVSWPTQEGIWILESASDVTGPWTEITGISYASGLNTYSEEISPGKNFFRLKKL